MKEQHLLKQVRLIIVFFMIMMVLSGITASPVESGLAWLLKYADDYPKSIAAFINTAHEAAKMINDKYPFILIYRYKKFLSKNGMH